MSNPDNQVRAVQVCAVVVTYNPNGELLNNIAAIRPQVDRFVIVDNGSKPEGLDLLETSRSRFECEAILNGSNLGIAKALNLGIAYAESQGCKQVVFFDQDSMVGDAGFIACMLEAYGQASQSKRLAVVAPCYVDRLSGAAMPSVRGRDKYLIAAMTSGMLVPIEIFKAVGLHDERLYMDYVDIEFCLRCRKAGYAIIEATGAILYHSLGKRTRHRLWGVSFTATNHNALRRYYVTRNRLLTLRWYWRDWRWWVRDLQAFFSELIKIVLVEGCKQEKLAAVAFGVRDAWRNKTGERFML